MKVRWHESNVDCIVTIHNLHIPLILTIGTLLKPHGRCCWRNACTVREVIHWLFVDLKKETSEIRFMPRNTHTYFCERSTMCGRQIGIGRSLACRATEVWIWQQETIWKLHLSLRVCNINRFPQGQSKNPTELQIKPESYQAYSIYSCTHKEKLW